MAKKQDEKSPSLEKAVERLEAIVEELESGEADLEKSIALYAEGKKLQRQALKQLDSLERRIQIVVSDSEEGLELESFEEDNAGSAPDA